MRDRYEAVLVGICAFCGRKFKNPGLATCPGRHQRWKAHAIGHRRDAAI